MLRPLSDMMIIEKYQEISGIELPEGREFQKGEFFVVKAIGPGYMTDEAKLILPNISVGDTVAIVGKILVIPFKGKEYLIARAGDAIAVVEEKDEKETKSLREEALSGEQQAMGQNNETTPEVQTS